MPTFSTTSEEAKTNGVKLMVFGPSGYGKTMLNATLPDNIIISAESGLLSLSPKNIRRVYGDNAPGISYNIPVIKVANIDDLYDAYKWARDSHEAKQYQTISLDSITEIMEQVLTRAKTDYKNGMQAYGWLASESLALMKNFREIIGTNIYMSSKMARQVDDLTNVTKYVPMAPGKQIGPQIPYLFDMMFALRVAQNEEGQTYRYLQTGPCLEYDAKDRSGSCEFSEFPHLGDIIEKIKASDYDEADASTHVEQLPVDAPNAGDFSESDVPY